jgi:hypothetical protein
MAGECIESGQTRQNGHFGEYSNSPEWQIFGEYSNSTNSPASGHCLIKTHFFFFISFFLSVGLCNKSIFIGTKAFH